MEADVESHEHLRSEGTCYLKEEYQQEVEDHKWKTDLIIWNSMSKLTFGHVSGRRESSRRKALFIHNTILSENIFCKLSITRPSCSWLLECILSLGPNMKHIRNSMCIYSRIIWQRSTLFCLVLNSVCVLFYFLLLNHWPTKFPMVWFQSFFVSYSVILFNP